MFSEETQTSRNMRPHGSGGTSRVLLIMGGIGVAVLVVLGAFYGFKAIFSGQQAAMPTLEGPKSYSALGRTEVRNERARLDGTDRAGSKRGNDRFGSKRGCEGWR
ncbi:MAG: hypothetical protein RL230_102 [Pseudomonadota bacterium]